MNRRLLSVILLCAITVLCATAGTFGISDSSKDIEKDEKVLRIWYTDEEMTDYINCASIAYQEQTGIKVLPTLCSGLEYVEGINEATIRTQDMPDLYIIGNDSIEKACLSGLACEVPDTSGVLNAEHFSQTALNAVTYSGKTVGYPLSFETAVLLYNDTFLHEVANKAICTELGVDPETTQVSEDEITAKMGQILPTSIVGILEFANQFDPPATVETFFKWDITDVLFNYWFAGAYMNVGGICGDNREDINLYNENAMYCLSIYQDFNQFFSIEADEVDYESVLKEFEEGKIMFTVADTGVVERLEAAKADGSFVYDYGVTPILMVNDTLEAKGLSVTNAVLINGYSAKKDAADAFAKYLSCDYVSNLYARSGKVAAYKLETYPYDALYNVMACYENSTPLPKIVESSNYWILAELCYTSIWNGDDVNEKLKQLSEQVKKEITGSEVMEEHIETPLIDESYIQSE